jgi:hypothetical protein
MFGVHSVSLNDGYTLMDAAFSSAHASSDIDCPDGLFETDIDKISQASPRDTPSVRSQQGTNFVVPIEVSRILEGGISFFQGGLMNEGITTWYAFDVERCLFIAVLGSTGDRAKHIPVVEKLSANQLLRYTDAAGYRRAEFVTVLEATPVQVREFACLANKLLASEAEKAPRPTPADTITKSFSLLHEGRSLDLGEGRKRWEIEGKLERFISQPLQELIMQAL